MGEYDDKTLTQLREEAAQRNISGRSGMGKDQLVEALERDDESEEGDEQQRDVIGARTSGQEGITTGASTASPKDVIGEGDLNQGVPAMANVPDTNPSVEIPGQNPDRESWEQLQDSPDHTTTDAQMIENTSDLSDFETGTDGEDEQGEQRRVQEGQTQGQQQVRQPARQGQEREQE